jgi:hypothetical protein
VRTHQCTSAAFWVQVVLGMMAGLRAARMLSSFLDGPMFLDAVADIGVHASRASLRRAAAARDCRAQVWSAVNQLEQSDTATKPVLDRWRGAIRYTVRLRAKKASRLLGRLQHNHA